MTFVDKSLLVKFYYLSQQSVVEALGRFWTEKKIKKKMPGSIIPAELISFIGRFEEMGYLQSRPHNGAPRLSEVHSSSVVLYMNTLREHSTSGASVLAYS